MTNSRATSTARAANRRSAARAMPDGSDVEGASGSPATATSVDRTGRASDHSRTRPGTVQGVSGPGDGEGSTDRSVDASSSHGEAGGPPPTSGSWTVSSVWAAPLAPPGRGPAISSRARLTASASSAKGWGRGRGRRGGRPRRAGAVLGPWPSSAHMARRPMSGAQTAWRTIMDPYCPVGATLPNPRGGRCRGTAPGP